MLEPLDHLQPQDLHSDVWKRFTQFLERRLEQLRELNDGPHDAAKTSEIRGSIKEIKRILDLTKPVGSSAEPVHERIVDGIPRGF